MERTKYCKHCGEIIDYDCVVCPRCGKQVEKLEGDSDKNVVINNNISNRSTASFVGVAGGVASPKSRLVALLLAIFGGEIGIHNFYVGRTGRGFLFLFTFGLFGFGWLWDIIMISIGRFKDKFGFRLINW